MIEEIVRNFKLSQTYLNETIREARKILKTLKELNKVLTT